MKTCVWTGEAPGMAKNDFLDPRNWLDGIVPSENDEVWLTGNAGKLRVIASVKTTRIHPDYADDQSFPEG